MKKILPLLLMFFTLVSYSQNGISYQALLVNPNGMQLPGVNISNAPLINKYVCLRFAILDQNSQIEYLETHKITTDSFGLVNLVIGTGQQIGGYASSFSNIVWDNTPKNLKVELDVNAICTYFVEISNQPFTYIPFAYYAANSNVQNATTISTGIIQLAGDLGGFGTTASAPIISNNAITTAKIINGAVTPIKIASGGSNKVLITDNMGIVAWVDRSTFGAVADLTTIVGSGIISDPFKVKDLGIITAKLADNAVTTAKLADLNVTTSKLADNAVTTAKLSDLQVTTSKLADNAVVTSKISNLNVTTSKLAEGAVTPSKIASGAANSVLVTDSAGATAWIDSATFGAIADMNTIEGLGTTTSPFKVKDLGISTAKLADNAVTTAKISDGTIINSDIADGTITTSKLSGAVAVANGGTGSTTLTSGYVKAGNTAFTTSSSIPVADVTGAIQKVNGNLPDANGNVTVSFGTVSTGTLSNLPIATGTNGDIYVVSGDATINNNGLTYIYDGTSWNEITPNQASLDARYLKLAGGTMAGTITVPTGKKIILADAPASNTDAVNKAYVDTQVTNATPDATSTIKGKIQLAGDLGGVGSTASNPILTASAVTTSKLADNAVTTAKLSDLQVTTSKLADNAVVTSKISNLNVTTSKLAAGAVTPSKIASGAANSVLVTDSAGAVAWIDSATFGAIADMNTIEGLGTTTSPFKVKDLGISTAKLADNAVTTAKISDGTIINSDIADGTITTSKLSGAVAVANGGTGSTTLTSGYVKAGNTAFTTSSSIPVADVTGAIQKVNGNLPDANGNVTVSFGTVSTGTLSNLPIATGTNGDIYVVSGDATSSNNGLTYIYDGTSWNEITPNQASLDARYLKLAGGTMAGTITVPTGKKIILADAPASNTDAVNKAYVDTQVTNATPDATSTTKGKIQLAGDLGGTATAPTVPALANKENTITTGTTSQYYRGDKTWQTLDKTAVGLANVDNTSDTNKPVSTATQTALDTKENTANKSTDVATDGASDVKFPSVKAVKDYVDGSITTNATPDADATTKGKIQLAGDLGGTAAAPTVPALANKENTITAGTTSQYYRGDKSWQTLDKTAVDLANVDNTSDANKPVSTATQTALDTKENTTNKSLDVDTDGTSDVKFPSVKAVKDYVDGSITTNATPDADTTTKGKIQLAGDLGGTAAAPTVPALANKENTITAGTTSQYYRGDKSWQTLDKTAVDLANVDNTSDANKPVSTATQTALDTKENTANKSTDVTTDGTSDVKFPSVKAVKDYVDGSITTNATPDADATTKGKIQLAGDLGGTAAAPTVPALANKENTITAGTTSQYYRGDKSWQTLDKTAVGLANVDNTSDTNKPVSTATQTALDTKENTANKSTDVTTDGTSDVKFPSVKAVKDYVDSSITTNATPDADATTKGKIQLAGDLGGTAAAPTVPALANKENTITAGTTSQYYRGDKSWQTLDKTAVGLANVDNTSDTNKPVSTATQTALDTKENTANKSTDVTTDGTSDVKFPSVKAVKDYVDSSITTNATPDADATTKGKIQLAGDLGGTAAAPTVPALANKENTITAGTTSQYYRGDKSWQTLDKTAVGLANVDNTSDTNKPVSTATQTALDTKENTANKSTDVATDGASDVKFPSVKAVKDYVDTQVASATIADADATTKGKIQLAGDLGGTAALPSITNTAVISKVLTGFTSGSGIIAATDNILQAIQKLDGNIALKAPLNSPDLTGTPTAPTATAGTNTTQIATTAFVTTAVNNLSVSTKSANYTATNTDSTLLCDASTAGFTLTLPSAAANNGKIIVIRKVDSTNNVLTVSPSLIWSGSNTVSSVNYATTIRVQSNGTSWYIIE